MVNLTGSVWFFLLIGKAGELGGVCVWGRVRGVGRGEGGGRGCGGEKGGEREGEGGAYEGMRANDCLGTELSLTVPITNSLAFLFTVLGEWWAEGKVIERGEWLLLRLLVLGGCWGDGLIIGRYVDWHGVRFGGNCALCAV